MRGTVNTLVVTLGLALAACGGGSSSTTGGTSGGGTTGGNGGTTGGGNGTDPTSACVASCIHIAVCAGNSSSAATAACQAANACAAEVGAITCSDKTGYFNCLAGVPCVDYALDGGGNLVGDTTSCLTAHCP
jgi:hypothetical protein